jgi:cytokinin dehydrogenase
MTLAEGRTPPVFTDYIDLPIGGTLSVGGFGGATHHYGA